MLQALPSLRHLSIESDRIVTLETSSELPLVHPSLKTLAFRGEDKVFLFQGIVFPSLCFLGIGDPIYNLENQDTYSPFPDQFPSFLSPTSPHPLFISLADDLVHPWVLEKLAQSAPAGTHIHLGGYSHWRSTPLVSIQSDNLKALSVSSCHRSIEFLGNTRARLDSLVPLPLYVPSNLKMTEERKEQVERLGFDLCFTTKGDLDQMIEELTPAFSTYASEWWPMQSYR